MTMLTMRMHDFEVEQEGPWFTVKFPAFDGDYYVTHTHDHGLAVKELKQFISEAEQALDELEALS